MTWLPWYWGIGPACLGIVVWAPFFDQLWVSDFGRHHFAWLAAGAIVALVGCYAVFYQAASWGYQAGRPLGIVAASTFGTLGSEWITGVGAAAAQVVWYAVALNFGIDATFLGLRACGLLPAAGVAAVNLGAISVKSPVYLGTALFWIFITRKAISMRLPGVVVALMRIYAPVALLLLSLAGFWNLPGLWGTWSSADFAVNQVSGSRMSWRGTSSAVAMILGFFVLPCLAGVDWGRAVGRRRDIMLGALPTILGVGAWTAVMSLVIVTATANRAGAGISTLAASAGEPLPFSFRAAIFHGNDFYPRGAAAAILILFGLAALAPAVASLNVIGEKFSAHWPRIGLKGATWIGSAIAFVMMVTGFTDRLGPIFTAMGVVFAPVLGAMAGDRLRANSGPRDIRTGINPAGILAWGSGFLIAAAVEFKTTFTPEMPAWLHQTAILGFLVAALLYGLFARMGLEPPAEKLDELDLEG
jgi:cytosine permease